MKVHSLTISGLFVFFALFTLPEACDVSPRSTTRLATLQPFCLGRKPKARVATEPASLAEVLCHNPSFGLATKAKGIVRVRAKRKPGK